MSDPMHDRHQFADRGVETVFPVITPQQVAMPST